MRQRIYLFLILGLILGLLTGPVEALISKCKTYETPLTCKTCEERHFLSPDKRVCLPCNYRCLECLNSQTCLKCVTGYFLDSQTKLCSACHSGCAQCEAFDSCEQCSPGRYLSMEFDKPKKKSNETETEEAGTEKKEIDGSNKEMDTQNEEPEEPEQEEEEPPKPHTVCLPCGNATSCVKCSGVSRPLEEVQKNPKEPSPLIGCKACGDDFYISENSCEKCIKGCKICKDDKTCEECYSNTKKRVYFGKYTFCLFEYQQNYELLVIIVASLLILYFICSIICCLARRSLYKSATPEETAPLNK